jgi:hypothetical protein
MPRRTGLRASMLVVAFAMVLALAAAAAVAATSAAPTLLSPNHKRVNPGRIRLVVNIPLKAANHGVFIVIAPKRKLDGLGHLKGCGGNRCDFVGPKHWKGHKYSYVAPFSFRGYWSVTRGKYYWQAHYYTAGDTAVYYSGIGSFFVK